MENVEAGNVIIEGLADHCVNTLDQHEHTKEAEIIYDDDKIEIIGLDRVIVPFFFKEGIEQKIKTITANMTDKRIIEVIKIVHEGEMSMAVSLHNPNLIREIDKWLQSIIHNTVYVADDS